MNLQFLSSVFYLSRSSKAQVSNFKIKIYKRTTTTKNKNNDVFFLGALEKRHYLVSYE